MDITRFNINGMFGTRNISLRFRKPSMILVGPNGLGKSTVINIFYFTITMQFKRLVEFEFESLELFTANSSIKISKSQLNMLSDAGPSLENIVSPRLTAWLESLSLAGELTNFLESEVLLPAEIAHYSEVAGIPRDEVIPFQRYAARRIKETNFVEASEFRTKIARLVAGAIPGKVLYLPTYRRIEKDLTEVFPELKEQLKRLISPELRRTGGKKGGNFLELIYFGMDDVRARLEGKMQELRGFSLDKYNSLSGIYLRDVIHGRGEGYNENDIGDDKIGQTLDRVSETALSMADKNLLRSRLKAMLGKPKKNVELRDRYLAHYFSSLLSVFSEIQGKEKDVISFVNVCNKYLRPSKLMVYDEIKSRIFIQDTVGKTIDVSQLSSGEKQVISLFTHLYFSEEERIILIIDEPELSLSVPWQQRLLLDVLGSGHCDYLLAVTHSPFIYDNVLVKQSVDLRKMIRSGS